MKRSIIQDDDMCYVCGNPNTEVHHVMYGSANRKLSDEFGLVVHLCSEHHRGRAGVHFNHPFDICLKKIAQMRFEAVYGAHTHFREVFGRNYL